MAGQLGPGLDPREVEDSVCLRQGGEQCPQVCAVFALVWVIPQDTTAPASPGTAPPPLPSTRAATGTSPQLLQQPRNPKAR